jgi:hypothetical protein
MYLLEVLIKEVHYEKGAVGLAHFSAFLKIKKNRNFNIFSHSKMLSKSSRNLAKY